ncbi:nucleotidyltransferase family protein [Sporosarcina sp. Te-1]|uniref:nucleotidyltransferase family protein n=1 Tax=Sporosarcina sp. Te-1 TaxID=2818390 RepID=UPI0035302620
MQSREDILLAIEEDEWMMSILRTVRTIDLPDWWICAGFVRSKIWDVLHGFEKRTPLADIDVIYFDSPNVDESFEKEWEHKLRLDHPNEPWSVKNQARMHLRNQLPPYRCAADAISKFPETATALGVKLDDAGSLELCMPHGLKDVLNCRVAATPFFSRSKERMRVFDTRMNEKNWPAVWSNVQIDHYHI